MSQPLSDTPRILYLLADLTLVTEKPGLVLNSLALPQLQTFTGQGWIQSPIPDVERLAHRSHLGHRVLLKEDTNCVVVFHQNI
jgi:hypothetical protein